MNTYEITYLSDPQLTEETRDELNNTVDKQITDVDGAVAHSSPSLRRKLAFPIKDKAFAFVRTMSVDLGPDKLEDVREYLKKHESIIRFTVLNTPKRSEVSAEVAEKFARTKKDSRHKKKPREDRKPAKKVTMEDVEKGIEEALTEEVK